jgi:4-hydroxyphenylacetate 3-monooxygenase
VEDLQDPAIAAYALGAHGSGTRSPEERVKSFKLAWDAVGSEFASRHTQYEMFYAGAGFVTRGHSLRTYDWQRAGDMVERMLASYGGPR